MSLSPVRFSAHLVKLAPSNGHAGPAQPAVPLPPSRHVEPVYRCFKKKDQVTGFTVFNRRETEQMHRLLTAAHAAIGPETEMTDDHPHPAVRAAHEYRYHVIASALPSGSSFQRCVLALGRRFSPGARIRKS